MTFSNNWKKVFRDAMVEKKMTVTDLSLDVNISRVSVYNFIDRRTFSKDMLISICQALDVDPSVMASVDVQLTLAERKAAGDISHASRSA